MEWGMEIKSIVSSRGFTIESAQQIEELLASRISFDNFDVTCSAMLQEIIREPSHTTSELTFLNIDSALDICALINPWNSMECSGVTGVTASYARSIQEFVRTKDSSKGDLRAACMLASAIAPGRPFAPIAKGSIKAKCEETCSGDLSKTLSAIDPAFCSLTMDLCKVVDFTLYSAFSSFSDRDFGIAVATSILLSEGSLGLRTSFREGCRFVLSLKQKGVFPTSPSDVSEAAILSSISEFYKPKLVESGLLTSGTEAKSEAVFLKVLVSQIAKASKSILDASVSKKQPAQTAVPTVAARQRRPHSVSSVVSSSEVSPLSEDSDDSLSQDYVDSVKSVVSQDKHTSSSSSPVLEAWFSTIKLSIRRGNGDVDVDFDDALNQALARIDSSSVYSSCVSELKRLNVSSHRKIVEACRKIDPFSHLKCQKLNHFELMFMIKLREELEKYGKDLIVDLKDLCALSPKMSMEVFLKNMNEELSNICIKTLQKKVFKGKYSLPDRVIKKACVKADYFRNTSCGSLVSSQYSDRMNLVLSLANSLFDKKSEKERLQTVRDSESNTPSYPDICNAVERLPVETVEDCVFEMRDSLSKYKSIFSMVDIEGSCITSLEIAHGYYPPHTPMRPGGPSIYPGYLPPHADQRIGLRRFYKDMEFAPFVSTLPWTRRDLPQTFPFPGRYIQQEFSESRKGFYRDEQGKSVYHDGNRYLIDGYWFIKVGDNWYIDRSTALDFIKVSPNDPRYNPYPLSLYEPAPDTKGVMKRKSFSMYLSPHTPIYHPHPHPHPHVPITQAPALYDMYAKPPRYSPLYPTYQPAPYYSRCKKCYNWIPYGHEHEHEEDARKSRGEAGAGEGSGKIEIKHPSEFDPSTGRFKTKTTILDRTGGPAEERFAYSLVPDPLPLPGTREVGIQTETREDENGEGSGNNFRGSS